DVLLGAELVVGLLPGADVAHPRLHEAALVARREMREIEHAVQIGAHLDQHAPLHPRRLYGAHIRSVFPLPAEISSVAQTRATIGGMPRAPRRARRAGRNGRDPPAARGGSAGAPPIDVYETASRYVVTAEVPGLARDQIDLAVQDNRLTIRGIRPGDGPETPARRYHQVERGHGSFLRTFEFVDAVDEDGITAALHDGVLTVMLPKIATAPRRIEVQ